MIYKSDIDNDVKVGRLGNKLFIIAAMIGYAKCYNTDWAVADFKYSKFFPNIKIKSDCNIQAIYNEPVFHFVQIEEFKCNVQLNGFFQSELYWNNAFDEVKFAFKPSKDVTDMVDFIWDKYKNINTTAVHIRRGDYNWDYYYNLFDESDYYQICMNLVKTDKYLIFSDDIEYVKKRLINKKCEFLHYEDIIDLFLISRCDNIIIGNSTFSWWGARLGEFEKPKTIFAPQKWFGKKLKYHNTKDLIPKRWILV